MATTCAYSSDSNEPETSRDGSAARESVWRARDTSSTVMVERSRCAVRRAAARRLRCACRSLSRSAAVLLSEIVETSAAVGSSAARSDKIQRLTACLRRLEPDEAAVGVAYLSSQLRQRQIGIGYAALRDLPEPAATASLTLLEVDRTLERIGRLAGRDSQAERRRQLVDLFSRATRAEQDFLSRLIIGELRQGALEGVMLDALAHALGVPLSEVRRAVMLRGDLGAVAEAGLRHGASGLA